MSKEYEIKSNLYYTSLELLLKDVYSKCAPEKLDTGIVAKAYVVRERSDFSLGLSLYHTPLTSSNTQQFGNVPRIRRYHGFSFVLKVQNKGMCKVVGFREGASF